jgi:hypothetical protein
MGVCSYEREFRQDDVEATVQNHANLVGSKVTVILQLGAFVDKKTALRTGEQAARTQNGKLNMKRLRKTSLRQKHEQDPAT